MPFAYYARLSPSRQRVYRQSDEIQSLAPAARGRQRSARRAHSG